MSLTLDAARLMHDHELRAANDPTARAVLAGRGRAATIIRVTLARTYGRPGIATLSAWHVLPCVTDLGTIGVIDSTHGTAWDTGVVAPAECADLGLEEELYAAAMPVGWRQIALPTWRGYTPDARRYDDVPLSEYEPAKQIRPRLVASGLMTCYGHTGAEPVTAPDGGPALEDTHAWDSAYPHGVPPWVVGRSVTVIDRLIDRSADLWGSMRTPPRTRLPRGTQEQERAIADRMIAVSRAATAARLRVYAADRNADRAAERDKRANERLREAQAYRAAADRIDAGESIAEVYATVGPFIRRAGNATNGIYEAGLGPAMEVLARAEIEPYPWEVASLIGASHLLAPAVFADLGLTTPVDGAEILAAVRPEIEALLTSMPAESHRVSLAESARIRLSRVESLLAAEPTNHGEVGEEVELAWRNACDALLGSPRYDRVNHTLVQETIRRLRVERLARQLEATART
jgi:hypothetical protein